MPKVSILMSVYNCEDTVKSSIESIINQTFKDWEFIICDDGSKDGTYKIVKELSEREQGNDYRGRRKGSDEGSKACAAGGGCKLQGRKTVHQFGQ